MNIYPFLLTVFGVGAVFSLLATLFERIIIINGLARGNTIGVIITSFVFAAFKQVLDADGSLLLYGLFIVIVGPVAANRYDLSMTISRGRWWWKSENYLKQVQDPQQKDKQSE